MGRAGLPDRIGTLTGGRWTRLVLRLGLSAAVLAVVAWSIDLAPALEGMARLRAGPWLAALAAFFALHAASALKWRWFCGLAGARVPGGTALRCHAAGLFANLCLPSLIGGDVLRAGLAMRATRAGTGVVVGSVVDRVGDFTALLVLSLSALPFVALRGDTPLGMLPLAAAVASAAGLGGLGAIGWAVRSRAVRRLPRKAARVVVDLAGGLRAMRRTPVRAVAGWLGAIGLQAVFVLVNARLGAAMGLDLDLSVWFLLWPLAKIAAMMPLSFGGLGVREAAFAALVAPFGSQSLAAAQSLVWQGVLIAGGLVCGAAWGLSGRSSAAEGGVDAGTA